MTNLNRLLFCAQMMIWQFWSRTPRVHNLIVVYLYCNALLDSVLLLIFSLYSFQVSPSPSSIWMAVYFQMRKKFLRKSERKSGESLCWSKKDEIYVVFCANLKKIFCRWENAIILFQWSFLLCWVHMILDLALFGWSNDK